MLQNTWKYSGKFPLPVEIIPMAQSQVTRELTLLGGKPVLREGFITDNGNLILDVPGLQILDPVDIESRLNHIAGVVTNGLFARRPANVCLMGTEQGVITLKRGLIAPIKPLCEVQIQRTSQI